MKFMMKLALAAGVCCAAHLLCCRCFTARTEKDDTPEDKQAQKREEMDPVERVITEMSAEAAASRQA